MPPTMFFERIPNGLFSVLSFLAAAPSFNMRPGRFRGCSLLPKLPLLEAYATGCTSDWRTRIVLCLGFSGNFALIFWP